MLAWKTSTPAPLQDLLETVNAAGMFDTLAAAARDVGFAGVLSDGGPFTLLAPTDEAFCRLPAEVLDEILADEERLGRLLRRHVVRGWLDVSTLSRMTAVPALDGKRLPVTSSPGVRIGSVPILGADIEASNGLIHVLEGVLLPD